MISYKRAERLLTVDNLSLAYGDKQILRNINLHVDNVVRPDIKQGQIVALLGPSGIGKTQLFRCLAGLQTATTGKITIGLDNKQVSPGDVGLVFQNYPLLKHRTIIQNLSIANRGENPKKIDELLERFGMSATKAFYPSQLSGGQRQRIALIQQLLCSDKFILMDEPFSGLDVKMKEEAVKVITEVSLVDEHNTIIITTHDLDTAMTVADMIWVLGFEYKDGVKIPGATCIRRVDLAEHGLAWNPDARSDSKFNSILQEIRRDFLK